MHQRARWRKSMNRVYVHLARTAHTVTLTKITKKQSVSRASPWKFLSTVPIQMTKKIRHVFRTVSTPNHAKEITQNANVLMVTNLNISTTISWDVFLRTELQPMYRQLHHRLLYQSIRPPPVPTIISIMISLVAAKHGKSQMVNGKQFATTKKVNITQAPGGFINVSMMLVTTQVTTFTFSKTSKVVPGL